MRFFQDTVEVTFAGIEHVFHASSVFMELTVGGRYFAVKWYAVIIAFGFALAALFGGRIAYTWKMDISKMIDIFLIGALCGIVGARLYYCAFRWDYYSAHLSEIPQIWNGGLAIYGGVIGGILSAFIVCRVNKLNFVNLLDLVGMSLLIGQGIGRWGNYANQEAFGRNSSGFFGMSSSKITAYIIENQASLPGVDPYKPVHPTFLYESLWCAVGFILLYVILKKARKFSGQMFLLYVIWYGTGRAIFEGLRTDSLYIAGTNIRVSQLLSICAAAVCLVLFVALLIKSLLRPKAIEGIDYYYAPVPFFKWQKKSALKPGQRVNLTERGRLADVKGEGIDPPGETPAESEAVETAEE